MGTSLAIGMVLGACIGLMFDNMILGIGLGTAIGIGVDAWNKRDKGK